MTNELVRLTIGRVPPEQRETHKAGKTYKPDGDGGFEKASGHDLPYRLEWEEREFAATVDALADVVRELQDDPYAVITRGGLADHIKARLPVYLDDDAPVWKGGRRTVRKHGRAGTLEDVATRFLVIDVDGETEPEGIDFRADPGAAAHWFIHNRLPAEFHGARCVWKVSSSGGTKPGIHLHLFFLLDRPLPRDPLESWAEWWNNRGGSKLVDPAPFRDWQIIYTSRPSFIDGAVDPFPGDARMGALDGDRETVELYVPTADECREAREAADAEAGKRARQFKIKNEDVRVSDGITQIGRGWTSWLRAIGDRDSVRGYMESAAAAYIGKFGAAADEQPLLDAMAAAVEKSPYLDTGEPGCRTRAEGRAYLSEDKRGRSNMGDFIAHVRENQRQSEAAKAEQEAQAECEHPEPGVSRDEGERAVHDKMSDFFGHIVPLARQERVEFDQRHADWEARRPERAAAEFEDAQDADDIFAEVDETDPEPRLEPPQIGIAVTPGVGKTAAAIGEVEAVKGVAQMALEGWASSYFVPTHKTIAEVVGRINAEAGKTVARAYYGREQLDPWVADGETQMCRELELVNLVTSAGGALDDACAGCPFNPANAGDGVVCGVWKQRAQRPLVWVKPSAILTHDRPPMVSEPDLVVIDEAPWAAFVGDTEVDPDDDLDDAAKRGLPRGSEVERHTYVAAVEALRAGLPGAMRPGDHPDLRPLRATGLTAAMAREAARLEWRHKRKPKRSEVDAARHGDGTVTQSWALDAERFKRAKRRRALWLALADGLARGADQAARITVTGDRKLRVRLPEPIKKVWANAPILYLDATMNERLARIWLPRLDVTRVRVEPENHKRTLVMGCPVSRRMIDQDAPFLSESDRTTSPNNLGRIADLIEVAAAAVENRGGTFDVLVISYKNVMERLRGRRYQSRFGNRVDGSHFGNLRGQDAHSKTPLGLIFGRPQPRVQEIEDLAAAIFGRVPNRRLGDAPLEKKWVRPRMAGNAEPVAVEVEYHPDPDVQAILHEMTAELEQADGRLRPVRRGPDNPSHTVMATSAGAACDLTFHSVMTWDELMAEGDEIAQMVAKGVVATGNASFGDIFKSDKADPRDSGKKRLDEDGGALREGLARTLKSGKILLESILGGSSPICVPHWPSIRYRTPRSQKAATVKVDPDRGDDPMAAIQRCIPAAVPAAPARPKRAAEPAATRNSVASGPERHDPDQATTAPTPSADRPDAARPQRITTALVAREAGVSKLKLDRIERRHRKQPPHARSEAILRDIQREAGPETFARAVARLRGRGTTEARL